MMKLFFGAVLFSVLPVSVFANSSEGDWKLKTVKTAEYKDRVIDMAAVDMQRAAISRIESILNNPIHKNKEPDLLAQLSTARLEAASIQFRIAHERAHRSGKALDLTGYEKELAQAVAVLDRFLKAYPKDPRYPEMIYLRANAHDESKKKELARRDYIELTTRFPEVAQSSPAFMRLAEMAIDENQHAKALSYLRSIESRSQDPLYPFALYKMAWSHFNLTHIREALEVLGRHIKFYDDIFQKTGDLAASEVAIRDNSLRDIALFYFEGIQKNVAGFSIQNAFKEFERYAGVNPIENQVIRLTSLLRTRNNAKELETWSEIVQGSKFSAQTKLSCYNILFENQNNRRAYTNMSPIVKTIMDHVALHPGLEKDDSVKELRGMIQASTQDLHKAIQDNKKSPKVMELVSLLEEIYQITRKISIQEKGDLVRSDFNLAEIYFDLARFERSSAYYWQAYQIRNQIPANSTDHELISSQDLFMRSLASRYKQLESEAYLVKDLQTYPLKAVARPKAHPFFNEWRTHVLEAYATFKLNDEDKKLLNFYIWESQKTRYSQGDVASVIQEFEKEFLNVSKPNEVEEAKLALWMDTLVASEEWESLHALSQKWSKSKLSESLNTQISSLEADSWIKLMEGDKKAGRSELVLQRAQTCQNDQKDELRVQRCKILAAETLAQNHKYKEVLKELEGFKNLKDPQMKERVSLLREEAYLSTDRYFDLLRIASQQDEGQKNYSRKLLEIALLEQSIEAYDYLLGQNSYCKNSSEECRLLRALKSLDRTSSGETFRIPYGDIFKAHKPYRSLYSVASVPSFQRSLMDRMKVLRNAFTTWNEQDTYVYWTLLPRLGDWLEAELNENRKLLTQNYKLSADPNSLANRFKRVQDFESSLMVLSKALPFSHLKSAVLKGASGAFNDLIVEIEAELPELSKDFVPALQKKKLSLASQIVETNQDTEKMMESRFQSLVLQVKEDDVLRAWKHIDNNKWVAAKYLQDQARKNAQLSAFSDTLLNARFMFELKAYPEAEKLLAQSEAHIQRVLASQGGVR